MSPLIVKKPLFGPLLGLNAWTFAVEALLYIHRTPALSKYNVSFDLAIVKKEKAEKPPPYVQWLANNFNRFFHSRSTVRPRMPFCASWLLPPVRLSSWV